jgi:hypothetical protein
MSALLGPLVAFPCDQTRRLMLAVALPGSRDRARRMSGRLEAVPRCVGSIGNGERAPRW